VFGGVIGGAVAIGPIVGGLITSGIGWEWIFFVNVPIASVRSPHPHAGLRVARPERHGVDWLGLLTFSGSLFLLVFRADRGQRKGLGLDADRRVSRRSRS